MKNKTKTTQKGKRIEVQSVYYDNDPAYQQSIFDMGYVEYLALINEGKLCLK
jgi:hypothetical protein